MKNPFNTLLSLIGFGSSAIERDIGLKEGECWLYSTRPGEEASFLVIRKIETLPKAGEIVVISVFGMKIKTPSTPTGFTDQVRSVQIPIAGASLRSSMKERVRKKVTNEDWREGYRRWREAYDSGECRIFTESVSECVGLFEEGLNHEGKG